MTRCIDIKNVSLKYITMETEVEALKNIKLEIDSGDFVSIIGPSGCGKTSLLSLIAGLLKPTTGCITINDELVTNPSSVVGYMLQQDHLFNWRTVRKNCRLGLEFQKTITKAHLNHIDDLLSEVGLLDKVNSHPQELSGGQKQRVALVRTLAVQPEIVLLDEPFSALDYPTRLKIQNDVYRILKDQNKTVILVTHDIPEAIAMSDYVVVMSQAPGQIVVKKELQFATDNQQPLDRRLSHSFGEYFNQLWQMIHQQIEGVVGHETVS